MTHDVIFAGCDIDGVKYAVGTTFELTRGCDVYQDCSCYQQGEVTRWKCEGQEIQVEICDRLATSFTVSLRPEVLFQAMKGFGIRNSIRSYYFSV